MLYSQWIIKSFCSCCAACTDHRYKVLTLSARQELYLYQTKFSKLMWNSNIYKLFFCRLDMTNPSKTRHIFPKYRYGNFINAYLIWFLLRSASINVISMNKWTPLFPLPLLYLPLDYRCLSFFRRLSWHRAVLTRMPIVSGIYGDDVRSRNDTWAKFLTDLAGTPQLVVPVLFAQVVQKRPVQMWMWQIKH